VARRAREGAGRDLPKSDRGKISGHHEIEIWGDGQQTLSFTYIDDAIDGTLRIMRSSFSAPLDLGSEEIVSINELAPPL
jgi:GDP-D-mannose 3',5'-epimerase